MISDGVDSALKIADIEEGFLSALNKLSKVGAEGYL